jgi:hypothetical protein
MGSAAHIMSDTPLPSSRELLQWHDAALSGNEPPTGGPLWPWIATNHRHNCALWAEEDLARRQQASDAEIVANKRAIDRHNQARNDATERVDEALLTALGLLDQAPPSGARLNSETAGSMIDRLSIMSLKIKAMQAQVARADVDDAHRHACAERLARLNLQRHDLGRCLDALLSDAAAGRAHFKVYRQFKMYNDPSLNPALVAERAQAATAAAAAGSKPT